MENKKKKSNPVKTVTLFVAVAVVLVLAVYGFNVLLKGSTNKDDGKRSETQKLLDKNLDDSYPATEREVVKVYCRIMKEMYSGECSEDQIQGLFGQMRKLYDEELISQNSYDNQFKELQEELKSYKKSKKKVVNYSIADSDKVKKGMYEGYEQALVDVTLSLKEKSEWQHVNQEFVMRKDDDGRWKILGWYQIDSEVEETDK